LNQTELDESLADLDLEAVYRQPVGVPEAQKRKRRKFRKYPRPVCTAEEKAAMYAYQKGRCGICGEVFPEKDLMVDHSYRLSDNRGLLCRAHNSALGFFKDSPQMLRNALRYLKRPRARQMRLEANKGAACKGEGKPTTDAIAEPESRSRKGPAAKKPRKLRETAAGRQDRQPTTKKEK
jgi:Recombination endonuclease VII